MANWAKAGPATLEVGQRVCCGGKNDGKRIDHSYLLHIAKMANLYQYCTFSGG